ncbi:hypothetical protein AAFF_G00363490 [Aldrovandia affinis]|uniref:Uncharacterized protein n=1 Tax=Aldrovandia affinis TaxID=143900 RepID=A0AAD7SHL4_9TELE|nr:hypothetical protein AAFF_G00363490 [Aldrovandia affinis]
MVTVLADMLSDRYNSRNHNVAWDGSIGSLDHNGLTVVGKVACAGVPRQQTRLAVCDHRVESRPRIATKVPKNRKCIYVKSTQDQVKNSECWREMETQSQRKLQSQPKALLEEPDSTSQDKMHVPHECSANYERTVRELKLQHNQTLANLKTEMESERILLEERICKLKQNVAGVLHEKSRERQKQLQELHKENTILKGEIAVLQSQLKIQNTPEMCADCQSLELVVEAKALQLIEREKTVEELQRFCRKFCKQLTQQGRWLVLMNDLHIQK